MSTKITPEELRSLSRAYPELGDKFRAAADEIERLESHKSKLIKSGNLMSVNLGYSSDPFAPEYKSIWKRTIKECSKDD